MDDPIEAFIYRVRYGGRVVQRNDERDSRSVRSRFGVRQIQR